MKQTQKRRAYGKVAVARDVHHLRQRADAEDELPLAVELLLQGATEVRKGLREDVRRELEQGMMPQMA